MPRATTKEELIRSANEQFKLLWHVVDECCAKVLEENFDFSSDTKKTEAHWSRDKNIRDVLIHLYEWHRLFICWIKANQNGEKRAFLPEPYTWKTYAQMNVEFWKKHQNTPFQEARQKLEGSHKEVMELICHFPNEELFSKGFFPWVGTSTLGSYCVSSSASHYDWAIKKIKAHIKKTQSKG